MTDHTELLERLDKLANEVDDDDVRDAAKAIRALQTQHNDLVTRNAFLRERPDLPVDRIPAYKRMQEQIEALQEQVKEYDKSIVKYLHGDYQHPRAYRPDQCPHDKYYYEDCGECDCEYWTAQQIRIKSMGDKE